MNKIMNTIIWIFTLITWASGLLAIYWIILKLTGHSPTEFQMLTALIVANIGLTTGVIYKLGKVASDVSFLKVQFSALARDFKEHIKNHSN
ncbi:MAG: hypothetical protein QW666_04450 [Candidatus Woesearchaeota archaeon]